MRKFPELNVTIPLCVARMSPVRLATSTVCIPLYLAESAPANDYRPIIYTDMPTQAQYNISRIGTKRPYRIFSKLALQLIELVSLVTHATG